MTQQLLAIVERSYPNLDDFNAYIQSVLTREEGPAEKALQALEA